MHELIIVFKSNPDSEVKNNCNYVDDRNIVTTDLKIIINYNNIKNIK